MRSEEAVVTEGELAWLGVGVGLGLGAGLGLGVGLGLGLGLRLGLRLGLVARGELAFGLARDKGGEHRSHLGGT